MAQRQRLAVPYRHKVYTTYIFLACIDRVVHFIAVYKGLAFDEPPLAVTMLRPSALDKIQELLLLGDRRQAYQFAMDGKLWAHAMVIASSIDKDSWKEVVNDFLRTELGIQDDVGLSPSTTVSGDLVAGRKGNWESLRVAYSLFSGQGAASGRSIICQVYLTILKFPQCRN